ncbi:MAG: hypothetical protein HYU64_04630 [Armatimonadetes bacterium]|nr:hypothetical protein [Armatimonadota bacterium]
MSSIMPSWTGSSPVPSEKSGKPWATQVYVAPEPVTPLVEDTRGAGPEPSSVSIDQDVLSGLAGWATSDAGPKTLREWWKSLPESKKTPEAERAYRNVLYESCGPWPAILQDHGFGHGSTEAPNIENVSSALSPPEVQQALDSSVAATGRKLDILILDSCLSDATSASMQRQTQCIAVLPPDKRLIAPG